MLNTISCVAIKCYFRRYKHDYSVKKMYFADIIELHHDQLGVYGSPAAMAAPSFPQIDIVDWFKGLFLFILLSNSATAEEMQIVIDKLEAWCKDWGTAFNVKQGRSP